MSSRIIGLIAVVVLTVLSTLFLQSFRHYKYKLSGFSYSKGIAGEEGFREINISEGGEKSELLPLIQKIFYRYRLVGFNKPRKSDFVVLENASEYFIFNFGPESVHISDNRKLPKRYYRGRREILELFDEE